MTTYDVLAMRTEAQTSDDQVERLASQIRPLHAILGLTTEVGEFADAYKRFVYYGAPLDRLNAIEELGDILWYVAIAASTLDTTVQECQQANIAKLARRYPERFTDQAALQRDLSSERAALSGEIAG